MTGFGLVLAAVAGAQEAPHELRNTSGWFLAGELAGTALISFVGPELVLARQPDPLTCEDAWCEPNGFDEAVSRALTVEHPRTVGHASHVFTVGLVPLVGFAGVIVPAIRAGEPIHALQDSVVLLDAFVLATGFGHLAKAGARRQRPAFYYGRADRTEAAELPGQEFRSFYSGDTTWAFSLASSAITLSALRGHESTLLVGIGAGAFALTGSTLRIVADMHWATDVLVGAAAGTAIGVAVPLLLHGREADNPGAVSLGVDLGARLVRLGGRW